jgi:hypothetical protein
VQLQNFDCNRPFIFKSHARAASATATTGPFHLMDTLMHASLRAYVALSHCTFRCTPRKHSSACFSCKLHTIYPAPSLSSRKHIDCLGYNFICNLVGGPARRESRVVCTTIGALGLHSQRCWYLITIPSRVRRVKDVKVIFLHWSSCSSIRRCHVASVKFCNSVRALYRRLS